MTHRFSVALVGDFDPAVTAHRAIPLALALAARELGVRIATTWLSTDLDPDRQARALQECAAVWCVPASPYRSMDGALRAIRLARETGRSFLGTCGGFQHALIEFARNVVGLPADHAEVTPGTSAPLIEPLSCSLVDVSGTIRLVEGSRASRAYGTSTVVEEYHCSYGLNPAYEALLASEGTGLAVTGRDELGAVRIVELAGHPFFLATLFQPERAALQDRCPPLIRDFVLSFA